MTYPLLDAAMVYGGCGWHVIPVRRDSKKPAVKTWKPLQDRKPTDSELLEWFAVEDPRNLALVTGESSGFVALDVDGELGRQSLARKELPPTRTAKTPHGTHFYFRHPGGLVPNASGLLPGVDLRGDGGYAIAPPSSYENGLYVWLDERDIAPAPQWLLALCRKGGSSPKRTFPEGVAAGQRNTRCTSHVGVWFQAGYADDAVLAMARLWNQSNEPPMDDSEVRGIVESIAERHGDGVEVHLERFDWTHGPVAHKWVVEQLLPEAARCWVIGEPGSASHCSPPRCACALQQRDTASSCSQKKTRLWRNGGG